MEMNHGSVINVALNNGEIVMSKAVYQYDHGLKLHVSGVTAQMIQQGHFAVESVDRAFNLLFTDSGDGIDAPIPDVLLSIGKDIMAYLYYEDQSVGYTRMVVRIPVVARVMPENTTMEDPYYYQASQLAVQLQDLIDQTEEAKRSAEDVAERAEAAATDAAESAQSAQEAAERVERLDPDLVANRFNALKTVLQNFLTVNQDGTYTAKETISVISKAEIDEICV